MAYPVMRLTDALAITRRTARRGRSVAFLSFLPRPPPPTLFPYTTLFRSTRPPGLGRGGHRPAPGQARGTGRAGGRVDRKSTRLNSSHVAISYAVFCLKKKKRPQPRPPKTRSQHIVNGSAELSRSKQLSAT